MSDSEISNRSEEDVEDLFGDDENNIELSPKKDLSSQDEDENKDFIENDTASESEEQGQLSKELKTTNITIPRHAVSYKTEENTISIKMPMFLNVDAHPFDPNEFKEKVQQSADERHKTSLDAKAIQNDLIAERLLNENTIRWRYSNSGNDEIIKQSNAHFIQWSDGSLSLKIGKELFDFREVPVVDSFLAKSYVDHEILQNDSAIVKSASLLPSSTATDTHRRLTQAVKNIQKKDKILNTLTHDDPMSKQRKADEEERKTLKMRRQLEQKRRLQEERLGKAESPMPSRGISSSAYERFERTYGNDEYDEEDDFVANDDEEIELEDDYDENLGADAEEEEERFNEGAERLKKLKDEGKSKYSAEAQSENEERRKRRRIIDSDEEDE